MRKAVRIAGAAALTLALCTPAVSFATDEKTSHSNTAAEESAKAKAPGSFTLEGAYLVNNFEEDPGKGWDSFNEILGETAVDFLKDSVDKQSGGPFVSFFVVADINADKNKDIDTSLMRLYKMDSYIKPAVISMVDPNNQSHTHYDTWSNYYSFKNMEESRAKLASMGYDDALSDVILKAGSENKQRIVFLFSISEAEFMGTDVAYLSYLNYELEITPDDLKQVDTFDDLTKDLTALQNPQWKEIDGSWYYVNDSGFRFTDQWVGDYYVGKDGKMATNQWIGDYYVGKDGRWIPDYSGK